MVLKNSVILKNKISKYSVPTILIEQTNLFRIKSLIVKFFKYQKQFHGGACPLKKVSLKCFQI